MLHNRRQVIQEYSILNRAQLPPKTPSTTPINSPSFPPQRTTPPMANFINPASSTTPQQQQQQSFWVDEFLDFSSAKRGAHRRSMSDSVTFLESPLVLAEECQNVSSNNNIDEAGKYGFDRLDDEQFMSLFSDDFSVHVPRIFSSSSASTSDDQNSNHEDQKGLALARQQPKAEPIGELAESSGKPHTQAGWPPSTGTSGTGDDSFLDPKRVKRILANRQSAQKSRVKKLQYISELEWNITSLQTEVSTLSPRVAFLDHQRLILSVDNSALKQRIAALAQDKIFKDAHQEALKREIERLRQVYQQHNLQNLSSSNNIINQNAPLLPPPQQQSHPPPAEHIVGCAVTDRPLRGV